MQNFAHKSGKQFGIRTVLSFILLAMVLVILGGCSLPGGKAEKVRQGMTAYLQDRYGLEFEVGKPYVTGSMSTAHYQAKAHPKGQPPMEFLVNDESSLENAGSGNYSEYYLEAKWSYQGKQEVEKKLREVYGEGADFNISNYEFVGDSAFKDLDYAQVFEKSHGRGLIHLHYDVFMNGAHFNKEAETIKAYQIMKSLVLDFGGGYSFSVTYIDKAFKQDYLTKPRDYIGLDKAYQGGELLNFLQVGYISSSKPIAINSGSDLVEFLKY